MSNIEFIKRKIVLGDFVLPTPQVVELTEQVTRWIWGGLTGGVVTGLPRIGKTWATDWLSTRVKTRSGQPIPVWRASALERTQMTDRKFYLGTLMSMKVPIPKRSTAIQDMSKLINTLTESSMNNDEARVILSYDEAQRLTEFEYNLLIDLHNQLSTSGVRLFVLQVGTRELAERRAALNAPELAHIKGRFFTETFDFRAPKSKQELQVVLSLYDEPSYWDGTCSATHACLRKTAWADTKLKSFAPAFYEVFRQSVQKVGFSQWPMSYLTSAIRLLLLDLLPEYDENTDPLALVEAAVKGSSILSADPEAS